MTDIEYDLDALLHNYLNNTDDEFISMFDYLKLGKLIGRVVGEYVSPHNPGPETSWLIDGIKTGIREITTETSKLVTPDWNCTCKSTGTYVGADGKNHCRDCDGFTKDQPEEILL